jgi:hypothetical protein
MSFSLARFLAMLRKELLQMRRDKATIALTVGMPLVQLFIFGYAINADPKHLPTLLVSGDHSNYERSFVAALANTGYFAVAPEPVPEREAERALASVGRIDQLYDHLAASLAAAGDSARISLGRRGKLNRLERYVAAVGEIGLAIENARALARGAVRAIALDDSTPPEVVGAIRELASAARELGAALEDGDEGRSREASLRAVRLANAVLDDTANLSAVHMVGQVRLVAVDLLRASGVPRPEAQAAVRSAVAERLDE